MLLKSEKTRIMQEYARFEGDTGSPEVQIAVLTARINQLTDSSVLKRISMKFVSFSSICEDGSFRPRSISLR